jgi:hypothetical protein
MQSRFNPASSGKKPSLLGAMDIASSCGRNPLGRNCDQVHMSRLNSSFRGREWRSTVTLLMVGTTRRQYVALNAPCQ